MRWLQLEAWCGQKLVKRANRAIAEARRERDEMSARMGEMAERHSHENQLLQDEIQRLEAHIDALVVHNAELAASRSLLADVENGNQITRRSALDKLVGTAPSGAD